jgi:tRNA dimethylallyltransferase
MPTRHGPRTPESPPTGTNGVSAERVLPYAESPPPVIVIFGPTAVGKSELLFSLLDQRFEIINADSLQVFRHMDVGTAKPSLQSRARLTHHLVDVADPSEQFNAGWFVKAAEALVPSIRSRGNFPVMCGGTAFYITSFLYGLPESPPVDEAIREKYRALDRQSGSKGLYSLLQERDPEAAARIQPNDRYRVIRALEVRESTGRSLFSFRWPRTPRNDFRFLLIGLEREREELYRRIGERVERMFDEGFLKEVKTLIAMGYGPSDPGMRGIGYRELLQMRAGCQTIADVRELIARNTRRYAKRQLTFFRAVPGVAWMRPDRPSEVRDKIEAFIAGST